MTRKKELLSVDSQYVRLPFRVPVSLFHLKLVSSVEHSNTIQKLTYG